MKHIVLTRWISILLFTFLSCKKDGAEIAAFSYEKAVGIWVPYQIVLEDRSIQEGPFTGSNHFGAYAESVQLNKDQTFVPVAWHSSTNFILKNEEKGTYQYSPLEQRLILQGPLRDSDYVITKFTDEELWLNNSHVIYRFKRKS